MQARINTVQYPRVTTFEVPPHLKKKIKSTVKNSGAPSDQEQKFAFLLQGNI